MVKLGWSSICLRFPQLEPEIMLDGMLNFKPHFMVWYCVWYEHCNGLFNIRNLVRSLILMFVRICLCDTILYTWFGKKWKRLKKFWGWKIRLVYPYFFKHLSLSMLISFTLIKKSVPEFSWVFLIKWIPFPKLHMNYWSVSKSNLHKYSQAKKKKFSFSFFHATIMLMHEMPKIGPGYSSFCKTSLHKSQLMVNYFTTKY